MADDQGNVAILFCDIVDFDRIIDVEKQKIVGLLDRIFREFDNGCVTYGCQKIEVRKSIFSYTEHSVSSAASSKDSRKDIYGMCRTKIL